MLLGELYRRRQVQLSRAGERGGLRVLPAAALALALCSCSGSSHNNTGASDATTTGSGADTGSGGSEAASAGGGGDEATTTAAGGGDSSSGDSGSSASSGGDRGSGGAAVEASGSGGSAGTGDGGRGGSNASGGAGGGIFSGPECEDDSPSTSSCDELDSVCQTPDGCCVCIDFEESSCGQQWACAVPENNVEDCPASPPEIGAECSTNRVTCQYCTEAGPLHARCGVQSGEDQAHWFEVPGLTCSG